ncbi:CLUMA_CG005174, isoform A [Clunio marinus]|uniref:CLUMA_CG005174, isoform A n=1 Tax=Clunio marinus TaxID=568069 RepID=A0A1J1HZF6_9DIPT|nr:CLUMA_CG005174, isoform A [Clunio marinus]
MTIESPAAFNTFSSQTNENDLTADDFTIDESQMNSEHFTDSFESEIKYSHFEYAFFSLSNGNEEFQTSAVYYEFSGLFLRQTTRSFISKYIPLIERRDASTETAHFQLVFLCQAVSKIFQTTLRM